MPARRPRLHRLVIQITPDQRQYLEERAGHARSLAQVVRDAIEEAMAAEAIDSRQPRG
jgi:hypothetical protein